MFVETIYLTQSSRRALLAISFVVFVVVAFGLGVGAFCGYIAFTGDRSLGVRAFFVFPAALAIAASAGLSAFVAVFTRALATRGGSLQVTPETLAIHHPGVLRRPLEVPREQVRAVWIEPKSADARPALLWRVMSILALGRMDDEDRSGPQRRPTLLLRSVGGTGNALAIQLDAPIELTDGRFGISSFVGGYRPGWKRRIGGIFAIVAEPDVARRAFESWGVLRGLSERALMPVQETGVMRAIRITTFVLLFLLMLTLAALVVALGVALALHESHRASRSDSCAQLASLPAVRPEPLPRDALRSGLDLARLTDIAPPAGFRAVRGYPRALDLTAAAATRNDPREGRRVLTRYRFSHGFERRWERGDELALVSAWEFATPADARAYDAYATSHVCGLVTRVSWTPGIAGSVGLRFPVDRFTADQVSFVRGPYRIVAFLRSPKLESTQRRIANLAGVAAQRARQAAERS